MVLKQFASFQPDPRSDPARLCFLLDCVDGALRVAQGDRPVARQLVAAAAEACDWGRVTPAYNYFTLPQGDLHGWMFCVLEPDATAVSGMRLVMRPFARFSGAAQAFAAALQAGVVRPALPQTFAELDRLVAAAPRTIAQRLQPLRVLSGSSPTGATDPDR